MEDIKDLDLAGAIEESEAVIIGIGREMEFPVSDEEFVKVKEYYCRFNDDQDKELLQYKKVYSKLMNAVKNKEYFIITTCVDDLIYKGGFDRERIVAPCGSLFRLQSNCHCNDGACEFQFIDGKDTFPVCEKCGKLYDFNIYGRENYNENGYLTQWNEYTKWLQRTLNKKLVLLELGVDFFAPTVIRWPFEKIAKLNYKARLYRINGKFPQLSEEIKDKGISINENSFEFIKGYTF